MKLVGKRDADDIEWIKREYEDCTDNKQMIWTYLYKNRDRFKKCNYVAFMETTFSVCKKAFYTTQKMYCKHWLKYLM